MKICPAYKCGQRMMRLGYVVITARKEHGFRAMDLPILWCPTCGAVKKPDGDEEDYYKAMLPQVNHNKQR